MTVSPHFVIEVQVDGEVTWTGIFYSAQGCSAHAANLLFKQATNLQQQRVTQYACRCEHPEAHSNGRRQKFT
jgi:hypothetical protein